MAPWNPQANDIFLAALEIALPAERDQYLERACGGEAGLREQVEALMAASDTAGSFLETPPSGVAASIEQLRTQSPDATALEFLTPSDKPGVLGRLGHYEILEVVGSGGMGIVLKARDEKLQRVVAIKAMAEALAASPIARRRFVGEAQAAAAIRDDHVVGIYAVEDSVPIPYLVMELISGVSLQQRLEQTGPLEMREICGIGMQIAAGLAAAHAQGVIHRDIKPANILLENGVGRVKITDFGLARVADDASTSHGGLIAGTPQYMSPEQARGELIDPRTDLFSLGSTLYAMCTGRAPFRASSTAAVLKRVGEDRPSPIREANPNIPQWLVDLIDQLQTKQPAARIQSAGEVAEQLRLYLAGRLDTADLPAVSTPPRTSVRNRPRWAQVAAAAVLLCLVGGLSLTEATGVTQLVPTVIRIVTGDGTLVVETDDPAMKVTVEGDGGLVITGAGLEEIRLRPGSYRVHADKEGQPVPLDKELVTVARGGRAIVKVKLETSPAQAIAIAEKSAFVLLGDNGVAERKFDTLAEAVIGASDGDTIEIRGNGPFITEPIEAGNQALTIRAGAGYRPVIKLSPSGLQTYEPMLHTNRKLILEGLEFQRLGQRLSPGEQPTIRIVSSGGSALHVANCRFRSDHTLPGYHCKQIETWGRHIQIQNCEFLSPSDISITAHGKTVILDNCVHVGMLALTLGYPVEVRLNRNTLVAREWRAIFFMLPTKAERGTDALAPSPARIEATGNVIDALQTLQLGEHGGDPALEPEEAESIFPRFLSWQGSYNVYEVPEHFLVSSHTAVLTPHGPKDLAGWKKFWDSPETGSAVGVVLFQGRDLKNRLMTAPEKLTPEDFRLRKDSAGYRAGKDGKDLGADVDLVGPGPAYERWKKTPEYLEWLKETGQEK